MNPAMNYFNNLTLKWKFTAISMVIVLSVIVASTVVFISIDYFDTRARIVNDALIDAEITGQACSAALLFADPATAKEILNTAKSNPSVLRAMLLDDKGRDFAEYRHVGEKPPPIQPATFPEGWRFEGNMLTLKKPVVVDQKTVGSIYIELSLRDFYHHELVMVALSFAIILMSLPLALWLSLRLQNFLTGPIQNLAEAANKVSETRDYSVRVTTVSKDELGNLVRVFNEMLAQIEERDDQLKFHASELESQVALKTDEHRKARQDAENATKLKDKFVSLVSHDLRSPLASLIGLLRILASPNYQLESTVAQDVLQKALTNTQGLVKMLDTLFDMSRISTGKIVPKLSFIEARNLASEVIGNLAPLAEAKGVAITNSVPPNLRLYADRALLREVLGNLLSNAIKFCHKGDGIDIFAPVDRREVIAVRDTGTGIAPEILKDIFNQEIKTSIPGTAGEKGSGFGLPLCKEIMRAHGGEISIESAVGEGSTFYVILPKAAPLTILVVDDQEVVRRIIREQLVEFSANILEAGNGAEAMEIVRGMAPHFIITDINMPVMDGLDFIKLVRNDRLYRNVPIIAMTSDETRPTPNGMDIRSYTLHIGANDFVNKPVVASDLVPRISRLLKGE